ncbi:MAG TPA: ABC transporter ATP-binding protein, partial [Firmicutes bacterium]|nr:ABC transporter ATP-binding protein [Bacillota bacterium]
MKRLLRHLKPYTGYIIGVLLLVFFQSLAELYLPTLMSDIVDTGIVQGNTNYILKIGGFMLLVAALGTICAILASYFSSKTAMGFGSILRAQVFERVEDYSLSEFEQFGTASLITRTTNDITQLQQVVMVMLRMMLSAPMMAIGGIIMAISLDAKLSLVIVAIMPIITLAIMILTRKSVPLFNKLQEKLDHLNLVVRENLTGMRVIRAFNKTEHEKKRFNNANKDLTETALRVYKMMALLMPLMMLLLNLGILALVWFGSIRIDNGSMQVGQLMAFIQYVMHIMFSFIMVSMLFVMIPRASASAARINEVLDVVPEMQDPQEEKKIINLAGHLEFRNVTFSYPGAEKPVLKDISFSVRPGETVAFIGGTGSGKSTLVDLILRFYDIDEGNILLNGVDIRDISQENLRKRIGYVPQKALLFNGTIRENIRYGNLEATDEEIKQAAEIAQALEFISDMPDGF